MMQPAQSPHLNISDLRFFACLTNRIRRERFGSIDDFVEVVKRLSYEYDSETLKMTWRRLFKMYKPMASKLRGHNFEVENTGTRKRQPNGFLARSIEVDQEASKVVLGWRVVSVEWSQDNVFQCTILRGLQRMDLF